MPAFGLDPAPGFPPPTEAFNEGVQYQIAGTNVGPQKPKNLNFATGVTGSYDAGTDTVEVDATGVSTPLSAGIFLTADTMTQIGNTGFPRLAFLSDPLDINQNAMQLEVDAGAGGDQVNVSYRNTGFRPRHCYLSATGAGVVANSYKAQMAALNVSSKFNPTSDNPDDYVAFFVPIVSAEGAYSIGSIVDALSHRTDPTTLATSDWQESITSGDNAGGPSIFAGEDNWWSLDATTTPPTVTWFDTVHSLDGFAAILLVQFAQSHLRAG